ncbi:BTAD domain-containing putative transcriptional regulator [Schumannella luteola]
MTVRLVLFGSFQAAVDGHPAAVRGDIPRGILARLGLTPGEYVTADELIAALWDDPPSTVLSSLRAHVSRLRTQDWGDVLSGGRQGYRLDADPTEVDVVHYRRLVTDASAARYDALTEAERLWRGEPLHGLRAFPFAGPAAAGLLELRRAAAVELAGLRLGRGEHAVVALGLADLVALHPRDEELLRLYSQALARAGRTGEALDAMDAYRREVEADGGDASEAVAALRGAIVRQDPAVVGSGDDDSRSVQRTGIPVPITRFVGRARELELIERGRAESRLVTLVGPGGVGKTRLAIEAARRTTSAVDDEQWLVDLALSRDAGRVLAAVADAVGAPEHSLGAVADVLSGRRSLLILDNAEHVLGAVARVVSDLLGRCEGLSILVTSREGLRMAGERIIQVEPLTGPSAPDALQLFLQRAADSAGSTVFTEREETVAARVCAALDGLPLALELAAARLDVLSLDELSESVLAGHALEGRAGRHDSIEESIEWSTTLLPAPELEALAQLAQFAGSFGHAAIAGVCHVDGYDSRELAVALARKSLLTMIVTEQGSRRFRLLESVRAHVRAAHPPADLDAWRERHLEYTLQFAEEQAARLRTLEAKDARARLGAARHDIDRALDNAFATGDRVLVMRFIGALAWYWYERGFKTDGRARIERALAMPGEATPDDDCWALRAIAFMSSTDADWLDVVRTVSRYNRTAEEAREPGIRMFGATMSAYIAALTGEPDHADELLAEATRIREEHDMPMWLLADDLMLRGDTLRGLGRPSQALDAAAEAYRRGTELGHMFPVKGACYVTGKTFLDLHKPKDAMPALRTGALRSFETEDLPSLMSAVAVLGAACAQDDRMHPAAVLLGAAEALGDRYGYSIEGTDGGYHKRHRDLARAAMSPDEWESGRAEGAAMTVPEVMRFVAQLG